MNRVKLGFSMKKISLISQTMTVIFHKSRTSKKPYVQMKKEVVNAMSESRAIPHVSYSVSRRTVNTTHSQDGIHHTGKYLVLLFTEANLMLSFKQHMVSLSDKSIVVLPPDTPYRFSFGSLCRYIRISFTPQDEWTAAFLHEMTHKYQQQITFDNNHERESIFLTAEQLLSLNTEQRADPTFVSDYSDILMTKLLMDLSYRQTIQLRTALAMEKADLIEQITHYIRENYTRPISLEEISHMCYHSKYYISRFFHRKAGLTIVEYINQQRIRHACEQLSDSTRSIETICFESGFTSLQHFYTVFRNMTKHSPLQYRKKTSGTI